MPGLSLALFAYAAILAVPASSGAQEAGEIDIVHGRADAADRMTVPVRISGTGPYRFLVDTGSQKTVLSTDLAARLALPSLARRRVSGVAGTGTAETAIVDAFGLGRRSLHGLSVLLFESRHIGADGIVGTDSLQDQRVLLDFAQDRMAVGDARSLGGNAGYEIVVTARRRSGQLIMTHAEIDGVRTDIVIDTGSDSSIGNRALQRALGQSGGRGNGRGTGVLTSVTGQEAIADMGFAKRLAVGGVSIRNVVIAYVDGPAFEALDLSRRPALLLGMRELRLFRRVAIDFATRKVMFDLPAGL